MSANFNFKIEASTITLVRSVGYTLLFLSGLDFIALFIPLKLMDSTWELNTIGALVARAPVPLIGFAFVFYRGTEERVNIERLSLKLLSWGATIAGILYFLLAPPLILNSLRLDRQLTIQIGPQVEQRTNQLANLGNRLQQLNSTAELAALASRLQNPDLQTAVQTKPPQVVKELLLGEINRSKRNVRTEIEATINERRFGVLKDAIRLLLGSIVCGFAFIYLGVLTQWAKLLRQTKPQT